LAEDGEAVLAQLAERDMSIMALSRSAKHMATPIEEASPDVIRAKIYKKHGKRVAPMGFAQRGIRSTVRKC
jgi:hypothetical protein